ncbi:uncharacterized protein M6B38_308815 [Iris pallida]|uniref:Uncharacterized protein n=1 Tax=Iris pallida TaxID=29817 RepID=A0AAX6HJX7_IRIPA|nr:uncharacterized protein M6B38_308815 [Iris pallida]
MAHSLSPFRASTRERERERRERERRGGDSPAASAVWRSGDAVGRCAVRGKGVAPVRSAGKALERRGDGGAWGLGPSRRSAVDRWRVSGSAADMLRRSCRVSATAAEESGRQIWGLPAVARRRNFGRSSVVRRVASGAGVGRGEAWRRGGWPRAFAPCRCAGWRSVGRPRGGSALGLGGSAEIGGSGWWKGTTRRVRLRRSVVLGRSGGAGTRRRGRVRRSLSIRGRLRTRAAAANEGGWVWEFT